MKTTPPTPHNHTIQPEPTRLPLETCFDNLQRACENTARLLQQREPGLITWHATMRENCIALAKALQGLGVIIPRSVIPPDEKTRIES